MAANAQNSGILGEGSEITIGKLEQLLRNLPRGHEMSINNAQSEEEVDNSFGGFAGMVSYVFMQMKKSLNGL